MKTKIKLGVLILALLCAMIILMPNHVWAAEKTPADILYEALESGATEINLTEEVNITKKYDFEADGTRNKAAMIISNTTDVDKTITINGNGNKIITSAVDRMFEVYATGEGKLNVIFKDVTLISSYSAAQCISTRTGNINLTFENATIETTGSGNTQPLTIGGKYTNANTVNLINTVINAGKSGYGIIVFNPVNLNISENSEVKGYGALYMKGTFSGTEPTNAQGSAGSIIDVVDSKLKGFNSHDGGSNSFATIIFEDDNIKVNIENSEIGDPRTGTAYHHVIMEKRYGSEIDDAKIANQVTVSNSTITITDGILNMATEVPETIITIAEGVTSTVPVEDYLAEDVVCEEEIEGENKKYITFKKHEITIDKNIANGTVTADVSKAINGETITLTTKADAGYQLKSLKAYTANTAAAEIEIVDGKFVMPNVGVIVKAEFEKIPYAIKIEESANGKVTASVEKAVEGEEIQLTITPDAGYELNKITVNGKVIEGGKFIMPAGEVTVKAEFTKTKIEPPMMDYIISGNETEDNKIGVVESDTTIETLDTSLKADTKLNQKVEEERQKGNQVTIEIVMEELEKEAVAQEEKQKILQTVAANQKVHQYFDISVLVRTQEKELGKLTQLTKKMKFSMEISKDLIQEGRKFYIIKLHGDEVKRIEATLSGTKLEFETDQFSTFALAYEDVQTSGGVPGVQQPTVDEKDDTPLTNEKDETPKTGAINISLYVCIALASMAVVGIVTTKKSSKHSK